MAVDSITTALGAGSGINIRELVNGLVDAQFAAKNQQIETRQETLTAQISTASELKSAISSFSSALSTLARNGSLSTQPTTSDPSVATLSLLTGASAANLSASVEVRQLAQAQATNSALIADPAAAIGTGRLTLTFGNAVVQNGAMTGFTAGGGTPVDITIDSTNNSLTGIAAAINAKKAGVTASVLSDANGARLVLKGATGESQAFTLTATEDAGAEGLAALNVGPGASGTTVATAAGDAVVAVDGVRIQRASNNINNLLPGVRLNLVNAKPGTVIQVGSQLSTEGLSQAVNDFVATYNQLQAMLANATDPVTGTLRSDSAARTLTRTLAQLTSAPLGPEGGLRTLAEMGVSTNRNGTLSVNATVLSRALSEDPASVEAMFRLDEGLPAALAEIATAVSDRRIGLGASEVRYAEQQSDLSRQREQALTAAEAMRTRMTQQFASMDARVAAYRSTQTFLEQQVDAWNNSNR